MEAATGTGKSFIPLSVLTEYNKIAIVVPTKQLQEQWASHCDNLGLSYDIWNGKNKPLGFGRVSIFTIEAALTNIYEYELWVYDEVHRLATYKRSNLFNRRGDKIGLTALLKRRDGGEWYIPLEIIKKHTQSDALSHETVNKIRVKYHPVNLTSRESSLYSFYSYSVSKSPGYKYVHDRTRIIRNAEKKIEKAKELCENANDRTIVFGENIEPINKLSMKLNRNHIVYHSKHRGNIDEFNEGHCNLLLTARALDEGYDISNANKAVMFNFNSSDMQHIQRNGRIARRSGGISEMNIIYTNTVERKWLNNVTMD